MDAIGERGAWSERDAQVEAWRAIVAVLSGEPVPRVAPGEAQATIEALAREVALSIAIQFQQRAQPILAGMVLTYAERQLADLFDTGLATVPDDPPDEPGRPPLGPPLGRDFAHLVHEIRRYVLNCLHGSAAAGLVVLPGAVLERPRVGARPDHGLMVAL